MIATTTVIGIFDVTAQPCCLKTFDLGDTMRLQLDRPTEDPASFTGSVYVNVLAVDALLNRLLVTLSNGSVFELTVDSGEVFSLTEGICAGSINNVISIACHPTQGHTVLSLDRALGLIKVWDMFYSPTFNPNPDSTRAYVVETLSILNQPSCMRFSRHGSEVVIGTHHSVSNAGSIYILSYDLSIIKPTCREDSISLLASGKKRLTIERKVQNVGSGAVESLRYSADVNESILVAASAGDKKIYLYDTLNNFAPIGVISGYVCHTLNIVDSVLDQAKSDAKADPVTPLTPFPSTPSFDFASGGKILRVFSFNSPLPIEINPEAEFTIDGATQATTESYTHNASMGELVPSMLFFDLSVSSPENNQAAAQIADPDIQDWDSESPVLLLSYLI